MKLKYNYIIIPLIGFLVLIIGGWFTQTGMNWYNTILILPNITPAHWVFPLAWNIIYVFTTISALIVWNRLKRDIVWLRIIGLFLINAFLNVYWTYWFFNRHLIIASMLDIIVLLIFLLLLLGLLWPRCRIAALLLIPYTGRVAFATYLNYKIWLLN